MIAVADATIGQKASAVPSLEPTGLGEDYEVLLSISRKLDALRKEADGAVSPVAAFDNQVVDLLEKIEHNTALLLKRGIRPVLRETGVVSKRPQIVSEKPAIVSAKAPKVESKAPVEKKAATQAKSKSVETKGAQKGRTEEKKPGKTAKPSVAKPVAIEPTPIVQPAQPKETSQGDTKQATRSQQARQEQREKRSQAELKKGLGSSIRDGLSRLGGAAYGTAKEIAKGETAQDAIGTAVGGPIYGAAKELKDAAKDILDIDPDSMTGKAIAKVKEKFGASEGKNGRDRYGRYIAKDKRVPKTADTKATRQIVKDVKTIRSDMERSAQIEDTVVTKSERGEAEQIETTEAISEKTTKTNRILKDNEDKERKRHRRLIRTILWTSLRAGRGIPGMPGRGGGGRGRPGSPGVPDRKQKRKGGPDIHDVDIDRAGKKVKPAKTVKPSKVPRIKKAGMLGKLGRFGKIGKIGGLIAGAGGLLGVGGMLGMDYLFGRGKKEAPDIEAPVTKPTRKPPKAKAPGIAEKLSVGKFQKAPAKAATKSVAKLGGKAASLGLRALGPLATAAFLGYDAVSGWNDEDMQARAFGLKKGQEATTGQKASSAVANVLDMGGLGTGLLSMLGVDVETADIAKKVHEAGSVISDVVTNPIKAVSGALGGLFGWGKKDKQQEAEDKKPVAQPEKPKEAVAPASSPVPGPMLVSQAVTTRKTAQEKINEIEFPKAQRPIEEIEKHTKDLTESGIHGGGMGMMAMQRKDSSGKMVSLLEEIAGQGKKKSREGRFRKPDSVIPQEYDDTILTLIAHDRL